MTWYVAVTLLVSIPLALQFVREQRLFRRLGPVLVECGQLRWGGGFGLFSAVWMTGLVLANALLPDRTPFGPLAQFLFVVLAGAHCSWFLARRQIRERGAVTVGGGLPWEVFKGGHWKSAATVVFQTTSHCTFTLDVPAEHADQCGAILERALAIPIEPFRGEAGASVPGMDRVLSSV